MKISVQSDKANKVVILTLSGRMDVAGVQAMEPEFHRQLSQAAHPILLDMAGVEFLGSMGIRLLLAGAKALQQRALAMVLLNPAALVEDTWYSAGLAEIIPVEHDYDAAMATCRERCRQD